MDEPVRFSKYHVLVGSLGSASFSDLAALRMCKHRASTVGYFCPLTRNIVLHSLRDFDPAPGITYQHELVHKDLVESTSMGLLERLLAHVSQREDLPNAKRDDAQELFKALYENSSRVHEGTAVYLSVALLNSRPELIAEYLSDLPADYRAASAALSSVLNFPPPVPDPLDGNARSIALDHTVKMIAAAALNLPVKLGCGAATLSPMAETLATVGPDVRFARILDQLTSQRFEELWNISLQHATAAHDVFVRELSWDKAVAILMGTADDLLKLIHRWCPGLGEFTEYEARNQELIASVARLEKYFTGAAEGTFRVLPRSPRLSKNVLLSPPAGGFRFQWLGADRLQPLLEGPALFKWLKLAVGYPRADGNPVFLHAVSVTKDEFTALPKTLRKLPDGTLVIRLAHRVRTSQEGEPFAFDDVASCLTTAVDDLSAALDQLNAGEKIIWHQLVTLDPNDRNFLHAMSQPGLHLVHYDEFGSDPFAHVMKLTREHFGNTEVRVMLLREGNLQPCVAYTRDLVSINCILCPLDVGLDLAQAIASPSQPAAVRPFFSRKLDPEFDRITAGLEFTYVANWPQSPKENHDPATGTAE